MDESGLNVQCTCAVASRRNFSSFAAVETLSALKCIVLFVIVKFYLVWLVNAVISAADVEVL